MKRLFMVLAMAALGCTDADQVDASDVLTLTTCPVDTGACDAVADGRSTVTVEVCVPEAVTVRAASLTATLQLSAGQWVNPSDPSKPAVTQVPLTAQRCAYPSFTTPTAMTPPVRIDAELAGFTVSENIALSPAPLDPASIEIVPSPAHLTANADIGLALTVRAKENGTPSVGTRLTFSVSTISPATTSAFFFPESTLLSGTSGSTKLSLNGLPTSVTVKVKATPPEDPQGHEVESVETTLTLSSVSP